ncbi:TALPID3 protein-like [Lytechinus variegatus]|uniref:TALPID3 protein-like n=1 Tax=Lytechinus variegatus TaxID=7654 RepID=UPI001BB15ECF|nr:TALPID3 protein-like [Lytechinus variegatus]
MKFVFASSKMISNYFAICSCRPDNGSHHQPEGSTSPAVKRAQRVAQQLGELNQQVKQTIQTGRLKDDERKQTAVQEVSPDRHYKEISKKLRQEAERDMNRRKQAWLEPAPVDDYLRRTHDVQMTAPALLPLPRTHITMSPSQHNAPVLTPMCAEAQALLKKVQTSKEMLEANLETVARTRDDEQFYQVIQSICREGDGSDFTRIKQAVDEQIAAIDAEIKRELHQGRHHVSKPSGRQSPPTKLLPDKSSQRPHLQPKGQQPSTRKPVGQQSAGQALGKFGKKKVQAKIDTGLRRPRKEDEQEEDMTERNKENLREKNVPKSPPRPASKPRGTQQDDERYLKHIYGHTRLQSQRSTLKDAPYLHFANRTPTKTKKMAAHHASPVHAQRPKRLQAETLKSAGVGTQLPFTSGPQYYFNPYPTGPDPTPIVAPAQHTSPADGQLIPMAIPLREPRLGVGMAHPVTIISDGRGAPARQVELPNVALIDVTNEEENKEETKKQDLTVQRLPNVDIDSIPATPAPSQERASPGTQQPNRLDKDIPSHGQVTEESRLASAKPHEEEQEEEEEPSSPEIPGISMEGMHAARQPSYHGPPFPPQRLPPSQPPLAGIQPSSDQLAEGIRRMEMLQTRAVDWVEQELMSRLISGTHLRQSERHQQPSTSHEARPVSPSSSENSDHVVGALGGGGLQFFVDAGQPVDPTLVNSLVQQVLEEKISLCLGQHQRERSSVAMPTSQDVRQPTPQPLGRHSPIPTPEPTPPASPIVVLSREPSPTPRDRIPTPEASEVGEAEAASGGAESETESWKDLMKDSDTSNEEANTIAAPGPEAVTTPPTTPPPVSIQSPPQIPGEEPQTPVPSPPSSPTPLVGVPSEPMVTPTPTPEPRSPVASEPEEDAFQATLHTPSPEPRLPSPTPSPLPVPPKAATPAPPSVESSTTTESTPPDSTITQTTGRDISEGEWLVSEREEGRVPDETLFGVPEMEAFDESSQSSTTSTVKGPTDPDKDLEEPRSEGEVDPNRLKLTRDPVVALLSRLRQAPSGVPHPVGMQPSATSSPHSISNASSSSVGEVSEGQRPSLMPPAERLLYQEAYQSKPPKGAMDHRRSLGEIGSNGEEQERAISPAGDGIRTNEVPSNESILSHSPKASSSQAIVAPSPVARVIQVGRQRSPELVEDEEVEGEGDLAEADMTAGGTLIDRPIPPSLYSTMLSDPGTRTMTPDAMNMDAYLQSGYLSQSFSQSEGGVGGATSDFEGSRLLGQTNNSITGLNASGAVPRGSSLFGTSGMFSEDSLEVGAGMRGREERMTQRSFQVTLPSIAGLDEKEEESVSEGEVHGGETISDVSEITL